MANLKNITEVPEVESLSGSEKVLLNVDGGARQVNVGLIKPKEEWDIDINIVTTYDAENDDAVISYTVNTINTYANIKNKIFSGELPKCKSKATCQSGTENSPSSVEVLEGGAIFFPAGFDGQIGAPEYLLFNFWGFNNGFVVILTPDDVIQEVAFF